ncbi:ATP-grasp domain-containing protein [candidate division GN15 bacterium]|nr:ATP-grasp domain-containing protein [candidate division GN15 bacterium]
MKKKRMLPSVMVVETAAKAALPVIWSSARNGKVIVAGASRRMCAGMFSRHPSIRFIHPDPSVEPDGFLEAVSQHLTSHTVDMLYPVGDVATDVVARHQDELGKLTRVFLPSYDSFTKGRDKVLTLKAAESIGVPIPTTAYPDESTLEASASHVGFPCLVKPAISAGARGITKVHGFRDLERCFRETERRFGRCFIQGFVPPGGMQYKADTVVDSGHSTIATVVYEKLRFYPPEAGSSVLNRTVYHPEVAAHVAAMMTHLKWRGFCDFDFILDPRDGTTKLMEINPRFPESFGATYAAGIDMVEMLWSLAHGRSVSPICGYREGQLLRFLAGDFLWFLTSNDRWRQLRSWLTFASPKQRYQVLSVSDPGPMVGYLLENLFIALSPKQRRARLRLGSDSVN